MTGYCHCAHRFCFAIYVGELNQLCEKCELHDPDHEETECSGCDNDYWEDLDAEEAKNS